MIVGFLLIICKTSFKMTAPIIPQRRSLVGVPTINVFVENWKRILARQKRLRPEYPKVMKARRKRWYCNNRIGSSGTRELIVKRERNTSAVTDGNTAKTRGNDWTNMIAGYHAKNKERIKQRFREKKDIKQKQDSRDHGAFWSQELRVWQSSIQHQSSSLWTINTVVIM